MPVPVPVDEWNQLYYDGKHAELGDRALAVIEDPNVKVDDALRLKIANALAWTNRLGPAMSQYKLLLDGSERLPASIALANSYRWSGRPDLAEPLYDRSLLDDFTNKDALEGLEYTDRELKPRTLMTAGGQNDSGGQRFRYQIASHRWRDRTRQHIFEIEAAAHQQKYLPDGLSLRQAHLGFRYEGVALPLNPQVWIKGQMTPFTGVYGGASVRVLEPNTRVSLERINWGVFSLSARALDARLSATGLGLDTRIPVGGAGDFVARINYYDVSDGNRVLATNLKFMSSWRPLGQAIKPYIAVDTRDVRFNTPLYWSPAMGTGVFGLGTTAEWAEKDWFFFLAGQLGWRLYGDAGTMWSASVGAQRWLNKNWALGFNLWAMSSIRDGARYRAHSAQIKLERLW